ncbi:unnamed protein product [Camellia sinensis]
MDSFMQSHGIHHQHSCPHTPSQNSVAERKHLHITETAIALLHQSSLPLTYWFDVVAAATYLINRLPSTALSNCSLFEKLFQKPPNYSHLMVFGCLCYPWLKPYSHHKLAPKSTACVFLGYHPSVKGYRCLNPLTGKIVLSRHVTFQEIVFPYASSSFISYGPSASSCSQLQTFFWSSPLPFQLLPRQSMPSPPQQYMPSSVHHPLSIPAMQPLFSSPIPPRSVPLQSMPSSVQHPLSVPHVQPLSFSPVEPRPSTFVSQPAHIPINSLSVVLALLPPPSLNTHPMHTRSKTKPLCLTASSSSFPDASTEPCSTKAALYSLVLFKAMLDEYCALQHQGT